MAPVAEEGWFVAYVWRGVNDEVARVQAWWLRRSKSLRYQSRW